MDLALCLYLIKQEAKERQIRKPDSVRQLIVEQPSPDENKTAHKQANGQLIVRQDEHENKTAHKQAEITQLIVECPINRTENKTAHKRLRFVN